MDFVVFLHDIHYVIDDFVAVVVVVVIATAAATAAVAVAAAAAAAVVTLAVFAWQEQRKERVLDQFAKLFGEAWGNASGCERCCF